MAARRLGDAHDEGAVIGSGLVDITLYTLDMGLALADLLAEDSCPQVEELEPQREAA